MAKIAIMLVLAALLTGCSADSMQYVMPDSYEPQVHEIVSPDGYPMETYVISPPAYDTQKAWEEWRARKEGLDRYETARKVWESENSATFSEEEERRIEEYCKNYGYARCREIDRTCAKEGCYSVTVACDDDEYDEGIDRPQECRRFLVAVSDEIDPGLTREEEEENE